VGVHRRIELTVALAVVTTLVTTTAAAGSPQAASSLLHLALRQVSSSLSTAPQAHQRPLRATAVTAPAQPPSSTIPLSGPAAVPVARLGRLIQPDLLITSAVPLGTRAHRLVASAPGVRSTLLLAAGPVTVDGTVVHAVAGDPGRLRAWTPAPSARSDRLWDNIAGGQLAASFDAGKNLRLPLGGQVQLRATGRRGTLTSQLGALASTGLPGVDLVMAPSLGQRLGLAPGAAMLVSAPHADVSALRDRLEAVLGHRVEVVLLHQVEVIRDAGSFLTRVQLARVLQVALSRVGAPYVWGATGPNAFDCSGLVGFAYAAAGIAVPRTSEQLWLAGPHVPPQDARPGDLLFWANDPAAPQDIDHVALYLGNGMMISAPHTGDQVHVAPVYGGSFRGVVRVDPAAAVLVGGPLWAPTSGS
jgi:cell wall-associated NlpC family hydrolase